MRDTTGTSKTNGISIRVPGRMGPVCVDEAYCASAPAPTPEPPRCSGIGEYSVTSLEEFTFTLVNGTGRLFVAAYTPSGYVVLREEVLNGEDRTITQDDLTLPDGTYQLGIGMYGLNEFEGIQFTMDSANLSVTGRGEGPFGGILLDYFDEGCMGYEEVPLAPPRCSGTGGFYIDSLDDFTLDVVNGTGTLRAFVTTDEGEVPVDTYVLNGEDRTFTLGDFTMPATWSRLYIDLTAGDGGPFTMASAHLAITGSGTGPFGGISFDYFDEGCMSIETPARCSGQGQFFVNEPGEFTFTLVNATGQLHVYMETNGATETVLMEALNGEDRTFTRDSFTLPAGGQYLRIALEPYSGENFTMDSAELSVPYGSSGGISTDYFDEGCMSYVEQVG